MKSKKELDYYFNWFREYVSSFYCKDDLLNRKIKKKEDHAAIGVRVLSEKKVLNSLSDRKIHLILYAILLHNKKDLYTKSKDQDLVLLSKLIRDADKLDKKPG